MAAQLTEITLVSAMDRAFQIAAVGSRGQRLPDKEYSHR
jgi:hypothetical protein